MYKNHSLFRRWLARWCWVERSKAYDDYQSYELERNLAARAELERATLEVATDAVHLPPMTEQQKADLTPMERAALLRVAGGLCGAHDEDGPSLRHRFPPDLKPPTFVVQIIRVGRS